MSDGTNQISVDSIALYLLDDDALFLESLTIFLREQGYSPQAFTDASEFCRRLSKDDVGCVVSDLRMQPVDGMQIQRMLKETESHLSLIVLTGFANVPVAVELMSEGAFTVLEKPVEPEQLLPVIDRAIQASRELSQQQHSIRSAQDLLASLTPEELAVLDCAASGKPNKTISEELSLSNRTVDRRRHSALQKLGAETVSKFAVIRALAEDPRNVLPASD